MTYKIIAITNQLRILKLSGEFYDLQQAKRQAHLLYREMEGTLQNVQIKAHDEHHIETIGDVLWP